MSEHENREGRERPAEREAGISRRRLLATSGAMVTAIGIVAIGGAVVRDVAAAPSRQSSPEASPAATPGASNTVTIGSYDIFFDPKEVTIPADTDVTITLPNKGVTLHNFSITDHKNENLPFDPIDIDIEPGAIEEVTINAPAGQYYFFCNVPGHQAAGMWGTLTVE